MKRLTIVACLFTAACSSSSPTTPTPPTTNPPIVPPPAVSNITVTPCPTSIIAPPDLAFYQQIGCNAFDGPMQSVRKWNVAPKLYIRTIDDAGAAIDTVTLDTVQNAMTSIASSLTGGKFGLASVERGPDTRDGSLGYVTVHWSAIAESFCGNSNVGIDGGRINFSPKTSGCSCGSSAIRPGTAKHELGHTFGYWHTDNVNDLMSNLGDTKPCDRSPSARELQAISYQYR